MVHVNFASQGTSGPNINEKEDLLANGAKERSGVLQ